MRSLLLTVQDAPPLHSGNTEDKTRHCSSGRDTLRLIIMGRCAAVWVVKKKKSSLTAGLTDRPLVAGLNAGAPLSQPNPAYVRFFSLWLKPWARLTISNQLSVSLSSPDTHNPALRVVSCVSVTCSRLLKQTTLRRAGLVKLLKHKFRPSTIHLK
jgi:hypothetical protein